MALETDAYNKTFGFFDTLNNGKSLGLFLHLSSRISNHPKCTRHLTNNDDEDIDIDDILVAIQTRCVFPLPSPRSLNQKQSHQ